MNDSKYLLWIGLIIGLVPIVTIPGDLAYITADKRYYYIFGKVLCSLVGVAYIVKWYLKTNAMKYLNEFALFVLMAYTVVNTYYLPGYYIVFHQVLASFALFLPVRKKYFFTITLLSTATLIGTIVFLSSGYSSIPNSIERFKFDSSAGVLIFSLLLIVGKHYLDKEKDEKRKADAKIEEQARLLIKRNEEISVKNERLNELVGEKSTLLHVMLHDITNPLHVILNSQNLLKSNNEDARTRAVTKVSNSVRQMNDLLMHVRELESLKIGKREVKLDPVVVNDAINETILLLEDKASIKGVELKATFSTLTTDKVWAEKSSLINSVLANFVSNAIKFSNAGSAVSIHTTKQEDTITIEVIDSGIGMPEKIKQNLFSRNQATNRPGTSGEAGTGFGMPLANEFVKRFKGSLEIHSKTNSEYGSDSGTIVVMQLRIANQEASYISSQDRVRHLTQMNH